MEKITIKQFVEGYSNLKSVQLRDKYITENLETKDSFLRIFTPTCPRRQYIRGQFLVALHSHC